MSTEIRSSETERRLRLTRSDGEVILWLDDMHMEPGSPRFMVEIRHLRTDFLAAVAAECDAVVIPREDLPEVEERGGTVRALAARGGHVHVFEGDTAESLRRTALGILALAEHLDAHPPVDEAQVEALTSIIRGSVCDGGTFDAAPHIARRLYAAGIRTAVRP